MAPRWLTFGDRSLDVVDPEHRRNAAQPLQAGSLAGLPREHVLRPRPDHRALPAPGQRHHQRNEVDGLAADHHAGILGPVHLRLRPDRRLDPPPRPDRRCRKRPLPVPLHRLQAALVVMLALQPLMQRREVHPPARLLAAPVPDRVGHRCRLAHLCRAPIHRPGRIPPPVIPHRSFAHPQQPRHRTLGVALLQQYRHRCPRLVLETTHRSLPADNPPENRSGQGDDS